AVEGQLPARAWAAAGAALAQIRLAGPAGLRDPARALFPASRALGLAPGASEYRAVLALAHYRLGRLNEARLQAEGANKPRPGGSAVAWCVLALVYARRRDAQQVRSALARALAWEQANPKTLAAHRKAALAALRKEAEAALAALAPDC